MFPSKSLPSVLLILSAASLASACHMQAEDDYWFPAPPVEGKADAVETLLGADIPSDFVDTNSSYMRARGIANLQNVGALDDLRLSVARRVDGIIANLPSDGKLHVAELVKMEDPAIYGSLFPDEKLALEELWPYLEAPDDEVVLDLPAFPDEDSITEELPDPVALPDFALIDDLPSYQQLSSRRLQLQFDADSDQDTVSLPDLEEGITDTIGRYTPTEVLDFEDAREFIAVLRQEVLPGYAVLELPELGDVDAQVGTVGTAEVFVTGNTHVMERAMFCTYDGDTRHSAHLDNDVKLEVGAPANTHIVVLTSDGESYGVPASAAQVRVSFEERSLVEVWVDGVRTSSAFVVAPVTPARGIKIYEQVGFRFQDSAGDTIARMGERRAGVRCGASSSGGTLSMLWTGKEPANSSPQLVASYPGANITPKHYGRYEMETAAGEPLAVEILEGDVGPVVFFYYGGERLRATYRSQGGYGNAFVAGATRLQVSAGTGGPQFSYFPSPKNVPGMQSANVLAYFSNSNRQGFKLSGLDRVE